MEEYISEYISLEEKEHLLSELHRFLIWIGEWIPEEVEIKGEHIKLHDAVWKCISEDKLSDEEIKKFLELIRTLEEKEKINEELILKENLTEEEAKKLFHESAALIRAILGLKECSSKIEIIKSEGHKKGLDKLKIDDAKRWLGFLKTIGKRC